ncbi:T9SS type A sorting domain-containing protein [Belliella aquatica]|uniref:Secretion system C-terminal sorting domain-containing protein n=4 Tax=Belliella aquatica TaxID=1323734 RepID=A0ABQ1LVF0_9BACT|nr:T9SS type A sorting domain-containing protein [Belliella aquatica]GGC29788.1 hypothetical protein GCM10010993_05880 [Belliella aquatica]
MNLPVTFDEANINYGVLGFEGAENSTIVEDPTDATNKVVKVVRSNTAATFAGTTVTDVVNGVQTGFATRIPFTATNTRMSVRVWSPDAGIQVRLKVEDFQDPTKSVETEATTTVAGQWETLTFNFANQATGTEALNLNNNFNKATIFFNFGVNGQTAGEKTYYFDDMAFVTGGNEGGDGGESGNLPTVPIDFESADLNYEFVDFEGGVFTRIANPQSTEDNNSGFVGQMVKGNGQVFAGTVIPLASPIDFSQGKTVRVKVFMPRVGAKLLFKVENQNDAGIAFEKEVTGTVANAWETFDIDYSAINTGQTYQKIVLIFDLGTMGDGSANFTYLIDDIQIVDTGTGGGGEADPNQMDLPVTFDEANINYGVLGFEGAENSTIVEDPTDATNKVVKVVRSNTAATFAGTTVTDVVNGVQTGFATRIPFTATNTRMSVRVWSPDAGIQVRLKVEDFQDPTKSVETEATTTVAGQWETLTFNFANQATGTEALNLNNNFNKATIFFNFGVNGQTAGEKTYYFDDMAFVTGGNEGGDGGESGNLPTVPIDFESADLNYEFVDFEGGVFTRIANPQSTEDNNSGFVGQMVKGNGQVFAGTVIPLASPIDFSQGKTVRVKVFMPRVGAKLLFKVENQNDAGIAFEKEVTGTVANAWETLDIDYSAINTGQTYQKIVLIFDLGTMGDGSANFTYLIDDIQIVDAGTGGGGEADPNQMDLPVTFDEANINYGVLGFEGAENSTIVEDPTDATNKVVKVVRSNTAATFAGTTVTDVVNGVQTGFATRIPFTATNTRMSVRVWSPDAGIQVRLKVEDFQDPTKSVETEATTTVAGQWETLTFNFANQATGTEALNLNNNFNKATIFFNFGVNGATAGEKTYYFDDMVFGEPEIDPCLGVEKPTISISGQGTESITLTSSSETGNQWFLNGSAIEGATNQTLVVSTFGIYTVQVTLGECVSEFADNISLVVNSAEIGDTKGIKVYPNPVENTLQISGLSSDVRSLQLYDLSGRLHAVIFDYQNGIYHADVSSISKGMYILWIQQGNKSIPVKIVKQ